MFSARRRKVAETTVETHVVGTLVLQGVEVVPIPIFHGVLPILGYRIGKMAYITDCSRIPAESLKLLDGLELSSGVVAMSPIQLTCMWSRRSS